MHSPTHHPHFVRFERFHAFETRVHGVREWVFYGRSSAADELPLLFSGVSISRQQRRCARGAMGPSPWAQIVLLTLVSVGVQVFAAPSDKLCQPPQIGEELQICDTVHAQD